jgi:L-fucose isomerase-like protein
MLQSAGLFEDPTFFADFTIRNPENDNSELLWHCGAFPPSLSENKKTAYVGEHFVLPSHAPGTCNWKLKNGNLTLLRFETSGDHYSVLCGEGKTTDGPFNKGTYVYLEVKDWPLWEERIIYGPYIHHISCIYGNYAAAVYEATRYIDGLEFDPVEPSMDEIRKSIRSN